VYLNLGRMSEAKEGLVDVLKLLDDDKETPTLSQRIVSGATPATLELVDDDPLNAKDQDEPMVARTASPLQPLNVYTPYNIESPQSYIDTGSGIHAQLSSNELQYMTLDQKEKAYVDLIEHTEEWFTMLDISFILSRGFQVLKDTRHYWWGHGTSRTICVPSSCFSQLEGIVRGSSSTQM